jgi:CRISPR/Cas system CSM-associated protein Csm3 (group 7 of RAMP superfamily)
VILTGKIHVATPVYRGNARKTLFTRDGDGSHRLVSLAGEIQGTAQALMDAFIGQSRNGKNIGLLNQLWQRLYGAPLPENLIQRVVCKLAQSSYPRKNFFDLRMGIKLDEDRWAAETNANYKMETVLRNSVFDLTLSVNESLLKKNGNSGKFYYLMEELKAERFWFGAGKSKGLGRLRLDMELPVSAPKTPPALDRQANHLRIDMTFDASNPVLVGWNWGKVDPQTAAFPSVEGRMLIGAMRNLPDDIRSRLEMALGGAIVNTEDWKEKFTEFLPRVTAIWLREQSSGEAEFWTLPSAGFNKLGKGKHAMAKKLLKTIKPFVEKPFPTKEAAEEVFKEALGKKANMAGRVVDQMEHQKQERQELDRDAWNSAADRLGLNRDLADRLSEYIGDEMALINVLSPAFQSVLPGLFEQVDQHIRMLQSDAWVDAEIQNREEHLLIKTLLKNGGITESHWNDPGAAPEGVRGAAWAEFLQAHDRVQFRHMLNPRNLDKSIANDRNQIELLQFYREQTRQELAQPKHIDYRAGGLNNREISQKYGKPYDTLFMRMLTWTPSDREQGQWEAYIPGSTVKGAFRKRAAQLLATLQGETRQTGEILDLLFGRQGQRGMVFFSDAYLTDPEQADRAWCSMDGIRMDPKTGQPLETAKHDYLYAYGAQLAFHLRMDLQDIRPSDLEAVSVFFHLLQDFQAGDIPLGGEKTSGFGWVQARMKGLEWLTGDEKGVTRTLFGEKKPEPKGVWQALNLSGDEAANALAPSREIRSEQKVAAVAPPTARAGFISHRSFGGYCGMLAVEAEALTPVHIKESGEPSFTATLPEGPVNGWDFFSMAPPEADRRPDERMYALPSRSLKGMLRHIYAIAADADQESKDLGSLNPADSLFGWVGDGPNQALMGRLSFDFGAFETPDLGWFKVPYPYGNWRYTGTEWQQTPGQSAAVYQVKKNWRLFPHAPLPPVAVRIDEFTPDAVQASYFRAVLPGARARFNVRFWNLLEEEMQRLLWCVSLEPGMAHKLGNHRYLGFGSMRLSLHKESHFIDWEERYAGGDAPKWRKPIQIRIDSKVIRNYNALKKGLDAQHL